MHLLALYSENPYDLIPKGRNGLAVVALSAEQATEYVERHFTDANGIFTMKIDGPLLETYGWVKPSDYAALLQAADASSLVRGIVVEYNTPGGEVAGIQPLGDIIASLKKPNVAFVRAAFSAGYWLASQHDTVIAEPCSVPNVGSVGVYIINEDITEALANAGVKVEIIRASGSPDKISRNPYEPFTDEARAEAQAEADAAYRAFVSSIRRTRPDVAPEALTGRVFAPKAAQKAGLIDGEATAQETYKSLVKRTK